MIKRYLAFVFMAYLSSLWTEENNAVEESMVIHSGEATYNGQEILLEGKVNIQHGIGEISASKLTLAPSTDKKSKFAFLTIEKDVVINLQSGGQLSCQSAKIDYQNLTSAFLGDAIHPDVIYKNLSHDKNEKSNPFQLILKSHQIHMDLTQESKADSKTKKTYISKVKADGHVKVYCNDDYMIFGDFAIYTPFKDTRSSGILYLGMLEPKENSCLIVNQNQDHIQAEYIIADTLKRQITCHQSKGVIFLTKEEPKEEVHFSSDKLIWDETKQALTLKDHVKASIEGIGELSTENEIRIYQDLVDGKKVLKTIESPEETTITYQDNQKKITHNLICHGPLIIYHDQLKATLSSPVDANGKIAEEKQVYFDDLLGGIYADQATVTYSFIDQTLVPSQINMQGNVKIFNCFDGHIQESGSILHYALTDSVEYDPIKKEMLLKAQDGKRVLLYDKVNNVQMSAPALKIKRDDQTAKASIQGIGDVRFTFIEQELIQLRQHFKLKENLEKQEEGMNHE